jgi:hypothetical protein
MKSSDIKEIKLRLDKGGYYILRAFLGPEERPTWNQMINSLNQSAHTKADFHVNDPFVELQVNYVIRRGVGYFYSFLDESDKYVGPLAAEIVKSLNENDLPFTMRGASIFMNLFTEDDYAKPHKDDWSNNLYIQCEGSSNWEFFENNDPTTPGILETLRPGDAVLFSGDVYHSVSANTPRASIVLRMPREGA